MGVGIAKCIKTKHLNAIPNTRNIYKPSTTLACTDNLEYLVLCRVSDELLHQLGDVRLRRVEAWIKKHDWQCLRPEKYHVIRM